MAVLPFANLSGDASAATVVMRQVYERLNGRFELADRDSVAIALREHRIRNTAELSAGDLNHLAADLAVPYVLVGTIDRYHNADSSSEVALSARLLETATGRLVWCNDAGIHADPRQRILSLGRTPEAAGLVRHTTRHLLHNLRFERSRRARVIEALQAPSRAPQPCRRIAVVTLGNESATRFAGDILTHQLLATLHRQGFELVDPGRVRELMLDSQELLQGEISAALWARVRGELAADFILTGTVSEYYSATTQLADEPDVAAEVRLIDAADGRVVWARNMERKGGDSALLFNLGYVHGLTILSGRMARDIGHSLAHMQTTLITPVAEHRP